MKSLHPFGRRHFSPPLSSICLHSYHYATPLPPLLPCTVIISIIRDNWPLSFLVLSSPLLPLFQPPFNLLVNLFFSHLSASFSASFPPSFSLLFSLFPYLLSATFQPHFQPPFSLLVNLFFSLLSCLLSFPPFSLLFRLLFSLLFSLSQSLLSASF